MKKPGFLAASVAAASATAASASTSAPSNLTCKSNLQFSRQENVSNSRDQEQEHSSSTNSASGNQFEPRFDGLRFIETLVTAHR